MTDRFSSAEPYETLYPFAFGRGVAARQNGLGLGSNPYPTGYHGGLHTGPDPKRHEAWDAGWCDEDMIQMREAR